MDAASQLTPTGLSGGGDLIDNQIATKPYAALLMQALPKCQLEIV